MITLNKNQAYPHQDEKDDLDPLMVMIIYDLLKKEAKYELTSQILTLKTKKAWNILLDEMYNVKKTSLFENLLSKMVQNKLIALDENQGKIVFIK